MLLQGGLANQLLQSILVAHCENISFCDLSVSNALLKSRLRVLRSVTSRDLSSIFFTRYSSLSPLASALARVLFRTCFCTDLYNGAISCVKLHRTTFYKGDGLTRHLFTTPFNKYWLEVLDILDRIYGPRAESSQLAIHVRRGDFAQKKTFMNTGLYPLPASYFKRAIELFRLSIPKLEHVDIFTDSPTAVSQEFSEALDLSFYISSGSSPEYDLWRLSHCPNIIISNSSFSAIAAHLASFRNSQARVICPNEWFNGNYQSDRHDLRLSKWRRC